MLPVAGPLEPGGGLPLPHKLVLGWADGVGAVSSVACPRLAPPPGLCRPIAPPVGFDMVTSGLVRSLDVIPNVTWGGGALYSQGLMI